MASEQSGGFFFHVFMPQTITTIIAATLFTTLYIDYSESESTTENEIHETCHSVRFYFMSELIF